MNVEGDASLIDVAGPRVGSGGTNLYRCDINADPLFTDGFESGDVSAWSVSCD